MIEQGFSTKDAIADAARNNHFDVLQYLMDEARVPVPKDVLPGVVFDYPDIDVLIYLVAHGADINATDDRGNTVIHKAPLYGRYFVDCGADIRTTNNRGYTPLLWACRHNPDAVSGLLQLDPNVTDCDGLTTLELAKRSEAPAEVIALLEAKMTLK
jgi:ankyrin repeat protein